MSSSPPYYNHLFSVIQGNNFFEGGEITREMIYADNEFDKEKGYITPLSFVATTTHLDNSVLLPFGMSRSELYAKLSTDQAGNLRPFNNNKCVTFGAIEVVETNSDCLFTNPKFKFNIYSIENGSTDPAGEFLVEKGHIKIIYAYPNDDCHRFSH